MSKLNIHFKKDGRQAGAELGQLYCLVPEALLVICPRLLDVYLGLYASFNNKVFKDCLYKIRGVHDKKCKFYIKYIIL